VVSFLIRSAEIFIQIKISMTQCVLLCELGMLERGVTKPRNKRRKKE
jgi:hypothetical protein